MIIIALSGGFDPIHVGHVRMIRAAANYGDVIVILNSDPWLLRKKGYVFMPWNERAEIIRSIRGVVDVIQAEDADGTVCTTLDRLRPDYFGNGGDRTESTTPERALCQRVGITEVYNLGGGKIQSSSELVGRVRDNASG